MGFDRIGRGGGATRPFQDVTDGDTPPAKTRKNQGPDAIFSWVRDFESRPWA